MGIGESDKVWRNKTVRRKGKKGTEYLGREEDGGEKKSVIVGDRLIGELKGPPKGVRARI